MQQDTDFLNGLHTNLHSKMADGNKFSDASPYDF